MNAHSLAKPARRDDPGIVQDEEFIAAQERWKISKWMILISAALAIEAEQARGVPAVQRSLGDLSLGKVVVELFEKHPEAVYQLPLADTNGHRPKP